MGLLWLCSVRESEIENAEFRIMKWCADFGELIRAVNALPLDFVRVAEEHAQTSLSLGLLMENVPPILELAGVAIST